MTPGHSRLGAAVAILTLVGPGFACSDEDEGDDSGPGTSISSSVETFPPPRRGHVQGRVNYPLTPPVGGDHNPVWQNCGFYSTAVEPERAVHSMEHGAVWVTYRPDLPKAEVDGLRRLAQGRAYILVSPWKDNSLPAPIVASAWGAQLKLSSATQPALQEFVRTYAGAGRAPEPGAPCTGAFGTPE